jgi:hypothetical protein
MMRVAVLFGLTLSSALAGTAATHAHVLEWRLGQSRQYGIGTCAKGPCSHRTDFSRSRPHCHLAGGGFAETRQPCALQPHSKSQNRSQPK